MSESISSPLHWKPVAAPVPTTLRGRYVTLEPLNAERHSEALWRAVRGHDDLWEYLFDGPFAAEADLRQSIEQKEAAKTAVFLAIVPAKSGIPKGAGELPEGAEGISAGAGAFMPLIEGESGIPEGAGALLSLKDGESRISEGAGAFMPLKDGEKARPSGPAPSSTARAAGYASFMRMEPVHGVIEVGNILLSPVLQRTTAATEAMYLMARHVFDDLGYRRYEWKCNAENQPSRRAALRLGFTFEGIFRQHMVVKDRNRDTAWFSMLDHEWPARKRAFESWLDPANFDEKGRQRQSLSGIAAAPH
ncbi:MAG: GNAT family N-acetyltransferase [Terracidiphilus sp.]